MAGKAVTLYLDEGVIEAARSAAGREGLSLSAYTNRRLVEGLKPWPSGLADLLGSLADEPLEAPPELDWETDSPRPDL
ncbi:MAG: hypothetical protein LBG60_06815 [Bifidobacteriaceae bacterium]|nr:hypothetical protein [Bifidobacteriaceae bacterium]